MIKWIVFDVDGTLIETALSNLLGLQEVMKDLYGLEYSKEELRYLMGIPGDEALSKLGVKEELIKDTWKQWSDNVKKYAKFNYIFDGIEDTLSKLRERYSLGIVTSKTKAQLVEDFGEAGILEYFKVFICKDDTEKHKPNPDPLLKLMERAKIQGEEAIYLGDALVDYEAASAARMLFGHCRYAEKTEDIKCELVFNKPEEITNYFIG
ncbi:HAD family hydrolase [Clostridium sp. 'White wine YQ']|uniref:HAD family hydrolase n=1 Tax=Clostridium sp. 'White wine YQ' TaxID=3027474 RepID=UPI002365ABC5|nr:HAD family hydrolase [Clostridium sp. 'White wine YQ']MDD7796282.1 HAD family hydrolase [Clostridium sp. 'White wine YQ']